MTISKYCKILPILLHIKYITKFITFHHHFKFESNLLAKRAGERGLRCALPASSWRSSMLHILPAQDMTWYEQNVREFRVSQSAVAALHTHRSALVDSRKIFHMPCLQICRALFLPYLYRSTPNHSTCQTEPNVQIWGPMQLQIGWNRITVYDRQFLIQLILQCLASMIVYVSRFSQEITAPCCHLCWPRLQSFPVTKEMQWMWMATIKNTIEASVNILQSSCNQSQYLTSQINSMLCKAQDRPNLWSGAERALSSALVRLALPPEASLSPQLSQQPHKPTSLQPRPRSPERPGHGNII